MSINILLAEDDDDIVGLLKLYLENEGFRVHRAKDGSEACDIFDDEKIDLALVDIMMPKMNGYELTKYIRRKSSIPIIILSAAQLDSDKILGLNLGADDYMVKPFNPLELIARINANLRRSYKLDKQSSVESGKVRVGELTLDTNMLSLEKNGTPIPVTATEYKILLMLMRSPGRVFTKMQMYEEVNGDYYENDDNTMMVHISNIRDKIEDDPKSPKYIKTVRGLGYKIEKQ